MAIEAVDGVRVKRQQATELAAEELNKKKLRDAQDAAKLAAFSVNSNREYDGKSIQEQGLEAQEAAKERARDFSGRESENPKNMTGATLLAQQFRHNLQPREDMKYFDPREEERKKQEAQAIA